MAPDPKAVLDGAAVDARLAAELPRWAREGDAIRRTYATHGWKGTLMVVTTVGHLAEAAWHHPDLQVGYGHVEVTLTSHDAGGGHRARPRAGAQDRGGRDVAAGR